MCGVALVAWRAIGRRHPLQRPAIVVSVAYDADAEHNESAVLAHLEDSVLEANHIVSIEGHATRFGASLLMTLDRDEDSLAATHIHEMIARNVNLLPRDAMLPVVTRYDAPNGPRFHLT